MRKEFAMKVSSKKINFVKHVLPVIFCVFFIGLIGRLFYLQVVRHDYYEGKAVDQHTWEITVEPERGSILDVNGEVFAKNKDVQQILMAPAQLKSAEDRATVASILNIRISMIRSLRAKRVCIFRSSVAWRQKTPRK